jgi:hypothetical protein
MSALPNAVSYSQIKTTLEAVFEADLPQKVTADFIEKKLGQTSDAASVLSLMSQFGMIAADGTPTILYHAFRNEETRGEAFAEAIRHVYRDLYRISERAAHYSEMYQPNETPHTSDRESLEDMFARLMDIEKDSDDVREHAGTFQNLCSLARFK